MRLSEDDLGEIALTCVNAGQTRWVAQTHIFMRQGEMPPSGDNIFGIPIHDGVYIELEAINPGTSMKSQILRLCLGYYVSGEDDVLGSHLWAKARELATSLNNGDFDRLLETDFVKQ
jgi:hypothetical protein